MSAALDIATGTLEPTATHTKRRWCWVPCENTVDGRAGSLTIVLQFGKRGRQRDDINTYGLIEDVDPARPHPGIRVFLLKKDGSKTGEVYRTVIAETWAECTCKAGLTKTPVCKHRDSLTALLTEGLL